MSFTKPFTYPLYLFLCLTILGCDAQAVPDATPQDAIHVDTLIVSPVTLRLSNTLPGRVTAFKEAEVRPQITGIIKSRLYKEGSYVEAGDVLFQIDPANYQSAVNSAEAELAKAIASQTSTQKAAIRYAELLKKSLTSQEVNDEAESAYQQAKAEVAVRKAELDDANLQLSYTKIKAPISGYAGFSQVSEGSLLTSGQSDYITTIIQTNNVYVDMKESSVSLYKMKQEFNGMKSKPSTIPVSITLEDGTTYGLTGELAFTDTQVDGSTGSVTLRAIMPNPDNLLLAGMYVRAKISMPESRDYLVVPQSVVVRSQSGEPAIYLVNKDNVTVKKSIILGHEVDNGWVVSEGVAAGDRVVTNNLNKIKNNQTVIVDNEVTAADETTPVKNTDTNSQDLD